MSDASRDYKVVCLSEAMSPITQAKGVSGNISLVNTVPVPTEKGIVEVPVISSNALRHRTIREPGWRWLIGEYGLGGKLDLTRLNFMLHGGNLTEGGGRENTRRIADFQRIFPLGRLIGGAIPDQIIAGSLHVHFGTLVCEENRAILEHDAGAAMDGLGQLRPAASFRSEYQYTRGDARKSAVDLKPTDLAGDGDSNLMIVSGQFVMPGSLWLHGFVMPHVSVLELGALLWSLSLWQSAGGTIGGMASRGHGRLRTSILAGDWEGEAAVDAYLDHARSVKDEAIAWLDDVFGGAAPEKAPKGGKGRKGSA